MDDLIAKARVITKVGEYCLSYMDKLIMREGE
jgi:hypothetical protein